MLAVPQIEKAVDANPAFGSSKWLWYIVLTFCLTTVVLLTYTLWNRLYNPRAETEDEEKDVGGY
jgi:hypothetical protein